MKLNSLIAAVLLGVFFFTPLAFGAGKTTKQGAQAGQGAQSQAQAKPTQAEMLQLADESRCLICHEIETTVRGPAWRDVAQRYRGQADAEEILVKKVYEGSSGVWGNDTMSANKRAGMDNIKILVRWILTLQ